MGSRGPAPKREEERVRRNRPEGPQVKVEMQGEVQMPPADDRWHEVAKGWYNSLIESGQAVFYEPSDWQLARFIAESMSRDMEEQVVGITEDGRVVKEIIPLKGASLNAYLKAFTMLGVSEPDRRRMGVEIQRQSHNVGPDESATDAVVTDINEARRRAVGNG